MDPTLKLWTVIVVVGLTNYLSRLSFIAIFARRGIPTLLARALRYVPAAMLTALVVPMIVGGAGTAVAAMHPRIVAAAVATVVAFLTGSTLVTLLTGLVTLWTLQAGLLQLG